MFQNDSKLHYLRALEISGCTMYNYESLVKAKTNIQLSQNPIILQIRSDSDEI